LRFFHGLPNIFLNALDAIHSKLYIVLQYIMKNRKNIILLLTALFITFSLLAYKRISELNSGEEYGVDAFYHVTMADGGPLFCISRTFPHTDMSIWKEHFYDKELIFHLILSAGRHWKALIGVSLEPPFHFSSLLFIFLSVGTIGFLTYRFDPKYAFLWPLLYFPLAPGFTNRLLMLRPHNLSIVILLFSTWLFPKVITYKQLWIPALFSFLFVYSYSNPHFILIPAFLWGMFLIVKHEYKLAFSIVGVTFLSLILAMLIHPQSPNTFILWKVQCVDVVREIIFNGYDIGIASELKSPDSAWLTYNLGVIILGTLNLIAAIIATIRNSFSKLSVYTRFFLILQTAFIIGIFFSIRSIEYAVPFSILTSALLWHDLRNNEGLASKQFKLQLSCLVIIILLPVFALPWTSKLKLHPSRQFSDYGKWAREHLSPGTLVANIGWGDFTRLFHTAPHCRYLVALDPMFAYAYNPEFAIKMRRFHKGEYIIYPDEMKQITGADFAFIGLSNKSEIRRMKVMITRLGYHPIYIGKDGCLFDLRKPSALKVKKMTQTGM
jgi:hypothetical protein